MKLINPTDMELDEHFAEYVAGWKREDAQRGFQELRGGFNWLPVFNKSPTDVMEWLEKCEMWDLVVFQPMSNFGETRYHYTVICKKANGPIGEYCATPFSRAAVIALLRANGVQVEFT